MLTSSANPEIFFFAQRTVNVCFFANFINSMNSLDQYFKDFSPLLSAIINVRTRKVEKLSFDIGVPLCFEFQVMKNCLKKETKKMMTS